MKDGENELWLLFMSETQRLVASRCEGKPVSFQSILDIIQQLVAMSGREELPETNPLSLRTNQVDDAIYNVFAPLLLGFQLYHKEN